MNWFEETEDGELTPTLPEEIRELIFNQLPQNDAVTARLVCHQWEQDINNMFNFSLQLSLSFPEPTLEYLLQLRIVRLTIKYQKGPQSTQLTFKYPNNIRELIVYEQAVYPHQLHNILQLCQASLKKLWISASLTYLISELSHELIYDFKNLRKIKLEIVPVETVLSAPEMKTLVPKSFLRRIVSSKMPCLSSLNIHLIVDRGFRAIEIYPIIVPSIVELISKNPKRFEELGVSLRALDPEGFNSNHAAEDMSALTCVTSLKHFVLNMECSTALSHWLILILNQYKLEKLSIGLELPLSVGAFQSVVFKNFETLSDIRIEDLDVNGAENAFDMAVFRNCTNLRSLDLTKHYDRRVVMRSQFSVHPDLINLSDLPATLTKLKLQGFKIRSRDLLEFLDSETALNLEILALLGCGEWGDMGINADVFEKLFLFQDQSLKTPEVYFQEINFADPEERMKFDSVLDRFCPVVKGWNRIVRVTWNLDSLRRIPSANDSPSPSYPFRFKDFETTVLNW